MPPVIQQHSIPEVIRALSGMESPDYIDLFTVTTNGAADASPDRWSRAAIEDARTAGQDHRPVARARGSRSQQRESATARLGLRPPAQVYVAGAPPKSPRYRFMCQVPEGQYDDERRAGVTATMTQAVAEAEGGVWPHPELRVCVFTCEVPEGWWGGAGRILRLADIYEFAWPPKAGVDGQPRETAEQVFAARRRQEAEKLLTAAGDRP